MASAIEVATKVAQRHAGAVGGGDREAEQPAARTHLEHARAAREVLRVAQSPVRSRVEGFGLAGRESKADGCAQPQRRQTTPNSRRDGAHHARWSHAAAQMRVPVWADVSRTTSGLAAVSACGVNHEA